MKIKKFDVEKILLQGKKEAPLEACGYLAGRGDTVIKIFAMTNTDKSSEHFSMEPAEQFKIVRAAREEGLDIVGVYHTHPNSPARPSEEDIRLAYDSSKLYVIFSMLSDGGGLKAFRIQNGGVSEELIILE